MTAWDDPLINRLSVPSIRTSKPIDRGNAEVVRDVRLGEVTTPGSPFLFFTGEELNGTLKYDHREIVGRFSLSRADALLDRYGLNNRPAHEQAGPTDDQSSGSAQS